MSKKYRNLFNLPLARGWLGE